MPPQYAPEREHAAVFRYTDVVTAYQSRPPYPVELYTILRGLIVDEPRVILELGCGLGEISPGLATDGSLPADVLFVTCEASLPDDLILMDTPDVDSIEKRNWEVSEHIRAAGDVLIAVLTAEKYKDERVVADFREAVASARGVIPVMNKAKPGGGGAGRRKTGQNGLPNTGKSTKAGCQTAAEMKRVQ